MHTLWTSSFPLWHFVVRGAVVYLAVVMLVRLGGKRQVGQMGIGEFVAILLISNAVQNAMNGGDNSITGGLLLAVVIISLSFGLAYATYRSKTLERVIEGQPRLLIHNGNLLEKNLAKELLSPQELLALLSRQGIHNFSDVRSAVMETNGSISITKRSEPEIRLR